MASIILKNILMIIQHFKYIIALCYTKLYLNFEIFKH